MDRLAKLRQVEEYLTEGEGDTEEARAPGTPEPSPDYFGERSHGNGQEAEGADASRRNRAAGAAEILRKMGEPLTTKQIAQKLVSDLDFAPLTGRNLEKRLYTVLSGRKDLFVKVGTRWTLRQPEPRHTGSLLTD